MASSPLLPAPPGSLHGSLASLSPLQRFGGRYLNLLGCLAWSLSSRGCVPHFRPVLDWIYGGLGFSAFHAPGRKGRCRNTAVSCGCSGAFCAMELQASCSPMFFCSHPQRGPCTNWFCSMGLELGRGPCRRCSVVTMVTAEAGVLGSDSPGVCIRSEGFSWSLLPPGPLAGLLQTSPRVEGGKQEESEPKICQLLCRLVDFREKPLDTWRSGKPMLFPKVGTQREGQTKTVMDTA